VLRQHLHRLEVWKRPEQAQRLGLGQPADDLGLAEKPDSAAVGDRLARRRLCASAALSLPTVWGG